MRRVVIGVGLACSIMVGAGTVRAEDNAEARAIIDKAIKATGGRGKISKLKGFKSTAKNKIIVMGGKQEFDVQTLTQWPDKQRTQIEVKVQGAKLIHIRMVNGEKGWESMSGMIDAMAAEQLADAREEIYAAHVTTLVPLSDAAFALTPLGVSKVNDKPAVGVKVTSKGHKDISLYFDKDSGLLVKSQRRVRDLESGKDLDTETIYTNYKELDGVKHSMKSTLLRNGQKFLEIERTEFKAQDSFEAKTFEKPDE